MQEDGISEDIELSYIEIISLCLGDVFVRLNEDDKRLILFD